MRSITLNHTTKEIRLVWTFPSASSRRVRCGLKAFLAALIPTIVLAIVMSAVIVRSSLWLVIYSASCSLHCHASSCTVVQSAAFAAAVLAAVVTLSPSSISSHQSGALSISSHPKIVALQPVCHSRFSRRNRELETGRLVERGSVGIRSGGGGDKGVNFLWIPGLQTVEVNQSFYKILLRQRCIPQPKDTTTNLIEQEGSLIPYKTPDSVDDRKTSATLATFSCQRYEISTFHTNIYDAKRCLPYSSLIPLQ